MGGFFSCLRFKNCERPKSQLVSKSVASKNRDVLVTKNQLTSVFLCEEKASPNDQSKHLSLRQNFDRESAGEELMDEVKFLKSCGVLLETPAELRKGSEKAVQTPSSHVHSNFDPSLLDSSCKTLHWEEQGDQFFDAATAVHENSDMLGSVHGSRYFEEHRTQMKIVKFDEGVEHISRDDLIDSANQNISPQTENQIQQCGSDDSPYMTPLSLSDDLMMTPGTACTSRSTGDETSIRTQYVYPVLNPVQNSSQWKEMREWSVFDQSNDQFGQQRDSWIQHEDMPNQTSLTFMSTDLSPDGKSGQDKQELDSSQETPRLVGASLSQWLKPPLSREERWKVKNAMRETSPSDKSPDADRPIIGMVAAHWNDNEPARVSPKWFDGHGIPNSTNKYKEDQKVSWHATPFEERLEKALSDEKLLPRRELTGRTVNLEEEDEESDTAASKTQP